MLLITSFFSCPYPTRQDRERQPQNAIFLEPQNSPASFPEMAAR